MNKIYMIFTGGTIQMKIDSESHSVKPALSANQLMQNLLQSELYDDLEVIEYAQIPSPGITNSMMLEMAKIIRKVIREDNPRGFVIVHGTDTLEETAFFLDTVIDTDIPIVVTGSMKSSSELGYDGINNMTSSVLVANSNKSKGRGVLVVFNDQINAASEVTKTNTMSLDTFKSLDYGPLGIVDNQQVIYHRTVNYSRKHVLIDSITKTTALVKAYAGADSYVLNALIDSKIDGIVIEALGRGNVPPTMIAGIERALSLDIPVVITSRCPTGRVFDSYGYTGGGKYLTDLGCILAPNLNGQKARILLQLILEETNDFQKIKLAFQI